MISPTASCFTILTLFTPISVNRSFTILAVTSGLLDITSAIGYTPIGNTQTEVVTDLVAPSLVHDNHVNLVAVYDDDSDRIVFEVQTAGAASVGSLTNSWWLGA